MALTGPTEGGPSRFPSPMADISGGIYACLGVLAALYARDSSARGTGAGQFIDVSLVDAQTSWLANIGASYFATGKRPPRLGNAHPSVTPYQPVRARDKTFQALAMTALGGPGRSLGGGLRALVSAIGGVNRGADPLLEESSRLATLPTGRKRSSKAGIPAGPVA
jgi:hypothetical protein